MPTTLTVGSSGNIQLKYLIYGMWNDFLSKRNSESCNFYFI